MYRSVPMNLHAVFGAFQRFMTTFVWGGVGIGSNVAGNRFAQVNDWHVELVAYNSFYSSVGSDVSAIDIDVALTWRHSAVMGSAQSEWLRQSQSGIGIVTKSEWPR